MPSDERAAKTIGRIMSEMKPRGGSRIALFIAGAVLAVVGAVISTTGTASAHNPVLSASANCSGVVNFTATSWLPPDPYNIPEHRTNPTVVVTYKVNGSGPDVAVTTGAFNPGNNFSFSGQFAWPGNADSIVVTAVAAGEWAIGTPGGGSFSTTVLRPDMPCQEESTTTTEAATTTTAAATTTTAAATTTTAAVTTTTAKATTTTAVGSEGPPTTQVSSAAPTTTVSRTLPRTGGGNGSLPLIALGLLLIGLSLVLGTRRQVA
jgi:LPXTG-motif cell wall-anchored protein